MQANILPIHTHLRGMVKALVLDVSVAALIFLIAPGASTLARWSDGAGTGPGGVGSTDGASTLALWLDAGVGVTTGGGSVSTWADQSGNGVNAAQATGFRQPTHVTNVLNGQPAVRFDGLNAFLAAPLDIDPTDMPNMTVFIVFESDQQTDTPLRKLYGHDEGGNWSRTIGLDSRDTLNFVYFGGSGSQAVDYFALSANTFYISSHIWRDGTPDTFSGWIDGASSVSGATVTNPDSGNILAIGAIRPDTNYEFWDGDIAEFIVYSAALNSAQRTLVENYLSAKYNISVANDKYNGNDAAYIYDVAGIGMESDGSYSEAHSAGLILQNGTFLQDAGDYLMVGHNDTQGNTGADLPTGGDWDGGNGQRWARIWSFSKTDINANNGTVTIVFDFSDGSMDNNPGDFPAGSNSNYRLLRRAGASGAFTDITSLSGATVTYSGDQVTFSGVSAAELGSYFTLGTVDVANSPTALELQRFTVQNHAAGTAILLLGSVVFASALLLLARRWTSR